VPIYDCTRVRLSQVDGELKQKGKTHDMLFSVPKLISFCSNVMTLEEGDIILTGTPAGVGPVFAGQTVTAGISGLIEVKFPVVEVDG
jgi:acylpyruvate hydrolase